MSLRSLHPGTVSNQLLAALDSISLTHVGHRSVYRIPIFRTLWTFCSNLLTRRTLRHRLSILVVLQTARIVPWLIRLWSIIQRIVIEIRFLPLAVSNRRRLADIADRRGCRTVTDHRWQAGPTLSLLVSVVHRRLPFVKTVPSFSWRTYPGRTDITHGTLPLFVTNIVGFLSYDPSIYTANIWHRSMMPSIRYYLARRHTARYADIRHRTVPFQSLATRSATTRRSHYAVSTLSRSIFPRRRGSLCYCLAVSPQSDKRSNLSLQRHRMVSNVNKMMCKNNLACRETVCLL